MKLIFRIQYRTVWGEEVRVLPDDGRGESFPLSTRDGIEWQGCCEIEFPHSGMLTYRYAIYRRNRCIRREAGAVPHVLCRGNAQQSKYLVHDCWRDVPLESYRYTSAFNRRFTIEPANCVSDAAGSCITFRALCPELSVHGQALGIIGSCEVLGCWQPFRPQRMREVQPHVWQLTFDAAVLNAPFEYKFVRISTRTGAVEDWEQWDNRRFSPRALHRGETCLLMETEVCFARPQVRLAGTAIPVFSLRSEGGFGVGDFGDLKDFIAWAADTGQRVVQVLPVNDTTMTHTFTDSYPYSSISIYALHPMYVDLRQLPPLRDSGRARAFEEERLRLNVLPQVDYEQVNRCKRACLKELFLQEGAQVMQTDGYRRFFDENREWLEPYAAFCYLRDCFATADFHRWEADSTFQPERIRALCHPDSPARPELSFHYFLQYELHLQLLRACDYGRSRGVIVKGDIPIGISRTSVEAWMEPHYFNLNGQAGAPPDAFSVCGQNWGMPTYNWKEMEKDGYRWWRQRFRKMATYFTAYRIDHILGFFRIWEIPYHSVQGLLGQFVPSLPMSVEEIQSFGLGFRKVFMTTPYISDSVLETLFGPLAAYVRHTFVDTAGDGLYAMKPEFDTQRKVEHYFSGNPHPDSCRLKEGLYALISDVLFIPDRDTPDRYHPRIGVQQDFVFGRLDRREQEAFNRLYNHYYYQRHNEYWYGEAMKKLPVLTQSTPMLACGEDLGMVPACVPSVMERLQILSLEIQRMPKDPACEFGPVERYPYLSVCSTGTHDLSTLRGWWKEDVRQTERFYHEVLKHTGRVPERAPVRVCEEIITRHLQSPSMLCILPWQDWTALDEDLRSPDIDGERINIPSDPHHYWRWRMHLTLEQLRESHGWNARLRRMIADSGRLLLDTDQQIREDGRQSAGGNTR